MKTEKCCANCKYGQIDTRNVLPILCLKSIRRVKSRNCIKYSLHAHIDKCRNWENAEECDFSDETENC